MINRTARRILLTLTLALLAGCANLNVGSPIGRRVDDVQTYLTTRAEVHKWLGSPYRTHQAGELTLDVHKRITRRSFACVIVSYRDGQVVKVTKVQ